MPDPSLSPRQTIREAAAYWVVRLGSDNCGPADRAAFIAWRDEHPDHAAAYEQTERALRAVDRHMGHPELEAMSRQILAETAPVGRKPPVWAAAGIAASVLLAAVVFGLARPGGAVLPGPAETLVADIPYETAIGERSTVTLPDGSVVTLNTNSKVAVDFSPAARNVELIRGQAYFEVAKDAARPFVVTAGTQRVTALGTAFDVRFDTSAEIRVVLVEGRVAVENLVPGAARPDGRDLPTEPVEMTAGETLIASLTGSREIAHADIDGQTSWRRGRLIFRSEPLRSAVAEVNRYSTSKLTLADDPRLDAVTVSGVFNIGRSDTFLLALQTVHNIDAGASQDGEMLLTWRE